MQLSVVLIKNVSNIRRLLRLGSTARTEAWEKSGPHDGTSSQDFTCWTTLFGKGEFSSVGAELEVLVRDRVTAYLCWHMRAVAQFRVCPM